MAIDAWLRSEAEIGVSVSNGGANCTPSPTMYWRYSVGRRRVDEPGSAAAFGFTLPAPWANGSPALETVGRALVIIADLISDGSQSGWRAISRVPMPAMCGDAMEVPDMKSQVRP